MFNKEIEKYLFRVKKINLEGEQYQGIAIPIFRRNCYFFEEYQVYFITLTGKVIILNLQETLLKNTQIKDSLVREKTNKIIQNYKKVYKEQLLVAKENTKLNNVIANMKKIELNNQKETKNLFREISNLKGFMMESDFLELIKKLNFETKNHTVSSKIRTIRYNNSNNILGFNIIQTWESEKHISEDDYDFLYKEYDGQLFIEHEWLEKSKSLREIKDNNFRILNKNVKIKKCTVQSGIDVNVGDKNTIEIKYVIMVRFDNPKEFRQETLNYIEEIINYIDNKETGR